MCESITKRAKRLLDSHTSTGQMEGLKLLNLLNEYELSKSKAKVSSRFHTIQSLKKTSDSDSEVSQESGDWDNTVSPITRISFDKSCLETCDLDTLFAESSDWDEESLSEAEKNLKKQKKKEVKLLRLDVEYMELVLKHAQLSEMMKKLELADTKNATQPESGLWAESSDPVEAPLSSDSPEIKSETVEFHAEMPEAKVDTTTVVDPTRYAAISGDEGLGNFLSRPIIIDKQDLSVGSKLNLSFEPWHKFLSATPIANKIQNYRWIRGDLHLKFLINGGPAFYGKILVHYAPHNWISQHEGGSSEHQIIQGSQRIHAFLDPTESAGAELTLPFVYNKDYLGITSADKSEVRNFGTMHYNSLIELRNSQTEETRNINITCYAHMTNVELAAPTDSAVLPQSGLWAESSDEYGMGIISKPASAVAKFAGKLKVVPMIAPYATATEMVAGGVGRLAHLFGYCRPVNVDPIRQYRPTYVGNLANTSIEEAVHKLSCDPKQGLTIDPRTIGIDIPGDELNVQQFCSRFSIVDAFEWGPGTANGARLAAICVLPALAYSATSSGGFGRQMTPLHMVQNIFSYWRGSLKFRFIVNASKFHRGRLAIVYRPDGSGPTTMGDDLSGVAFTRIVDISETRDFELDVGWFQQEQYLRTDRTITNTVRNFHSPSNIGGGSGTLSTPTYLPNQMNGTLTVYVVNELTNLNEASDTAGAVNITWGVSACDDISFAEPNNEYLQQASITPRVTVNHLRAQSAVWAESAAIGNDRQTEQANLSQPTQLEPIGPKVDFPAQNLVNFGENFDSLRALFKRYVFYAHYINPVAGQTGNAGLWQVRNPDFPIPYGANDTWGIYQNRAEPGTPSTALFTPFLTPPYALFAYCFLARRGGIRHKYVASSLFYTGNQLFPQLMSCTKSVDEVTPGHTSFILNLGADAGDPIQRLQRFYKSTALTMESFGGTAATVGIQNPALELEMPFYRGIRYDTWYANKTEAYNYGHMVECLIPKQTTLNAGEYMLSQFTATGEDFSLNWFVNCPILWQQSYPSTP